MQFIYLDRSLWRAKLTEHLMKKECFLSGIARITSPLPPFRATCTSFFSNHVLRVWQKNANYDNHSCNDNYDGNFDDNDDKKWPNNISILRVLGKKLQISGTNTWYKKGQKIWAGASFSAMPERRHFFPWRCFPKLYDHFCGALTIFISSRIVVVIEFFISFVSHHLGNETSRFVKWQKTIEIGICCAGHHSLRI